MSPEKAKREFNAIRSVFMANDVGEALERSDRLREDFHSDDDPVLGVRIDLWHAVYLSMHGRTTEALTVLHVPMAKANGPLKEQVFADRQCCFELVYTYFLYAHTAMSGGTIQTSALEQLYDEAEKVCVATNAPGWMSAIHTGRAQLYVKLGRSDDALAQVDLALALADRQDTMLEKAGMIRDLARVYSDLDRYDLAESLLLNDENAKRPVDKMYYIVQLGHIRLESEAFEEAAVLADRAGELADLVTTRQACAIWGLQTGAYLGIGDIDRADAAAKKMREAATILGEPTIEICAYFDEIDVHVARGEMAEAVKKIDAAQILADKLDGATEIRTQNDELNKRRERYEKKLT